MSFPSLVLVIAGISLVAFGAYYVATAMIDSARRRDDASARRRQSGSVRR
ncbi:MAG: hypothetical protein ACRDKI_07040 [Solirubrobacterales bacterium]